jgi:hypothetical protein
MGPRQRGILLDDFLVGLEGIVVVQGQVIKVGHTHQHFGGHGLLHHVIEYFDRTRGIVGVRQRKRIGIRHARVAIDGVTQPVKGLHRRGELLRREQSHGQHAARGLVLRVLLHHHLQSASSLTVIAQTKCRQTKVAHQLGVRRVPLLGLAEVP